MRVAVLKEQEGQSGGSEGGGVGGWGLSQPSWSLCGGSWSLHTDRYGDKQYSQAPLKGISLLVDT